MKIFSKGKYVEAPIFGQTGSLKIKLMHFSSILIKDEANYKNLSFAVLELLKFRQNN